MFTDALGLLSDAQAFSSTAVSTNAIDLGNITPKNEIGNGEPMEVLITVDVAADGTTTDETYEFRFIQSANANLSSEDNLCSRTITYANLTAGSVHHLPVPPGSITKRYIGLKGVLGGTTPSVTITALLMPTAMVQKLTTYAKGYTIS